ncbi:MAG: SDR family oxidoreductase [Rhodospirillaceae bacterium]|nr:SDR family oxidoreductase [Rhodospirillaceae bacterium]
MDHFDLSGTVAVVTGSSRGIGRAIARTLASAGAKVTVTSRKIEACEAVASEIIADGGKAIAVACNVSDKVQVSNLVRETQAQHGPVDILVCNAATNPTYGPMADLDDRAVEKIFTTNVQGPAWLINLVAPQMAESGGGAIILLSSIAGLTGSKNLGAYAVSKAADAQLARNYAVELGAQNIRVNAISPGLIRTDFARALWEGEDGQAFAARTPLGRLGEPEDIAGVASFLASDAARFITGQVIVVDGGALIADPF